MEIFKCTFLWHLSGWCPHYFHGSVPNSFIILLLEVSELPRAPSRLNNLNLFFKNFTVTQIIQFFIILMEVYKNFRHSPLRNYWIVESAIFTKNFELFLKIWPLQVQILSVKFTRSSKHQNWSKYPQPKKKKSGNPQNPIKNRSINARKKLMEISFDWGQ